jgi:hypothetical protein
LGVVVLPRCAREDVDGLDPQAGRFVCVRVPERVAPGAEDCHEPAVLPDSGSLGAGEGEDGDGGPERGRIKQLVERRVAHDGIEGRDDVEPLIIAAEEARDEVASPEAMRARGQHRDEPAPTESEPAFVTADALGGGHGISFSHAGKSMGCRSRPGPSGRAIATAADGGRWRCPACGGGKTKTAPGWLRGGGQALVAERA